MIGSPIKLKSAGGGGRDGACEPITVEKSRREQYEVRDDVAGCSKRCRSLTEDPLKIKDCTGRRGHSERCEFFVL